MLFKFLIQVLNIIISVVQYPPQRTNSSELIIVIVLPLSIYIHYVIQFIIIWYPLTLTVNIPSAVPRKHKTRK